MAERLPYREGTWFAVPLDPAGEAAPDEGYGVGLAARIDGSGGILGYFFGPRRLAVPTLADMAWLSKDDAIWIRLFGDLHLIEGKWPIIGDIDPWEREAWPFPECFIYYDDLADKFWKRYYDEETLEMLPGEDPCDRNTAQQYPEDGLSGAGAVEIGLSMLLNPRNSPND